MLGLLLFCVAWLGVQRFLADARSTVTVWAASHDLSPETRLGSEDLVAADVRLPDSILSRYARTSETIEGHVVVEAVAAGELLPKDALAPEGFASPGRSITLPVPSEHAVGGMLRPGDRVDVLGTFDAEDPRARTTAVARDLRVVGTVEAVGIVSGDSATIGITVAATARQAAKLAFAIRTADVDLIRVDGSPDDDPGTVSTKAFR